MQDLSTLSFQKRLEGFMIEYAPLAKKWGVDIGARLFVKDVTEAPVETKTEDNIKQEEIKAVK